MRLYSITISIFPKEKTTSVSFTERQTADLPTTADEEPLRFVSMNADRINYSAMLTYKNKYDAWEDLAAKADKILTSVIKP